MNEDLSHQIDQKLAYKADDHIDQVHTNNLDVQANHIYLFGEESYISNKDDGDTEEPGVEYSMANKFIKNMNILMRKSPNAPILIHMKTCGGSWTEGMAIFNMIKACPNPVTILNYTHARSMSSIIFQAADKRVMMPDTYFLFHEGTLAFDGTAKKVMSEVEYEKICQNRMLEIYTQAVKRHGKLSKKSNSFIKRWLQDQMNKKEDVFITETQAVELGFADVIFGENGKYDWSDLVNYEKKELEG